MSYIQGSTLEACWKDFGDHERSNIEMQLASYTAPLRALPTLIPWTWVHSPHLPAERDEGTRENAEGAPMRRSSISFLAVSHIAGNRNMQGYYYLLWKKIIESFLRTRIFGREISWFIMVSSLELSIANRVGLILRLGVYLRNVVMEIDAGLVEKYEGQYWIICIRMAFRFASG